MVVSGNGHHAEHRADLWQQTLVAPPVAVQINLQARRGRSRGHAAAAGVLWRFPLSSKCINLSRVDVSGSLGRCAWRGPCRPQYTGINRDRRPWPTINTSSNNQTAGPSRGKATPATPLAAWPPRKKPGRERSRLHATKAAMSSSIAPTVRSGIGTATETIPARRRGN